MMSWGANGTTESASYTYDVAGRLATASLTSNGASAQRRFDYDRWGNRPGTWDATTGGNQIQSLSLQQSGGAPTNRITSVTNSGATVNYSYDANGNVTSDGVHAYQYDAENRLVSVDSGATASYAYDHQNRRIKKTVGETTLIHYVWQDNALLAEHNAGSGVQITDYVYASGKLIAAGSGSSAISKKMTYYLSDRMSERVALNSTGGVVGRQSHLPFGEDFAESGTQEKHHFTTYERDSETGNDYAMNREYAPATGRYLSADPYTAGCTAKDPRGWNRYSYTRNVAINRVDPQGLFDQPPIEGGCPPAGTGGTFPGKCLCVTAPVACDKGIFHPNPDDHSDGQGETEPSVKVFPTEAKAGDGGAANFIANSASLKLSRRECSGEKATITVGFHVEGNPAFLESDSFVRAPEKNGFEVFGAQFDVRDFNSWKVEFFVRHVEKKARKQQANIQVGFGDGGIFRRSITATVHFQCD